MSLSPGGLTVTLQEDPGTDTILLSLSLLCFLSWATLSLSLFHSFLPLSMFTPLSLFFIYLSSLSPSHNLAPPPVALYHNNMLIYVIIIIYYVIISVGLHSLIPPPLSLNMLP